MSSSGCECWSRWLVLMRLDVLRRALALGWSLYVLLAFSSHFWQALWREHGALVAGTIVTVDE